MAKRRRDSRRTKKRRYKTHRSGRRRLGREKIRRRRGGKRRKYSKRSQLVSGSSVQVPDGTPVDVPLKPVGHSKFDILSMPEVQNQVKETYYDHVEPIQGGGDSNSSVVVFDIKGNDHHLCLSDCELIVECKLVGANGNPLPNSIHQDKKKFRRTCIEPQLIHSLWSNVEVKINNANIRAHVHHYGLKAYIDTLLTTDQKDQETLAVTTLFEKELNFDENWTEGDGTLYTQHKGRILRLKKSGEATNSFFLRDRLKHFIFEQEKPLLPRVDLQVELTRAKPEHCLMSWVDREEVPQIKIVSIRFWMKYQKLFSDQMLRVEQVLSKYSMLMPLSPRIGLSYLTIGAGVTTFRAQAVFHGASPTQVILGMIDGRNFLGDYQRSLYRFQHFDLNEIWFTKNGVKIPTQGYVDVGLGGVAINRGSAMYAWKSVMELGKNMTPPKELNISYNEWCTKGYTLFVFDFTADKRESMDTEVFSQVNTAPVNIHMQFRTAVPDSINVILYSKYDGLIKLAANGSSTWNWV